jgi:D-tagatose-1,6-bisphosphate aldolase subunit GatZ/KbaZ
MKLMSKSLSDLISAQKNGEATGMYSVCSANKIVLETSVDFAARNQSSLLIEATCNQVNQYGGYTGMLPNQFVEFVLNLVDKYALPEDKVILGGDHLGPYPWRNEPASLAMQKAKKLVRDYVAAGYLKIHLDASMPCADDTPNSSVDIKESANRAAELCKISEEVAWETSRKEAPAYVIGTEVPLPGGIETGEEIHVTKIQDIRETIEETKKAFVNHGLESAWNRVIAVVVHSGVDYGDRIIYPYNRGRTAQLTEYIKSEPQIVFEAHSTDYQTQRALEQMVEDQFAILKVGPELTFVYREAVFALEWIEIELLGGRSGTSLSNLSNIIEAVMMENPLHWQNYYSGTEQEKALSRKYSFSDRIRYYWPDPKVQMALERLNSNLIEQKIPQALISQFFPIQFQKIKQYNREINPRWLVQDKIHDVLNKYASACESKKL